MNRFGRATGWSRQHSRKTRLAGCWMLLRVCRTCFAAATAASR
ncbi:MAG: hypothetical protein WC454_04260 [Phycisphaerae bacterium]